MQQLFEFNKLFNVLNFYFQIYVFLDSQWQENLHFNT